MAAVVVASFNVENLFARPKAFSTVDWAAGEPVLAAYREFTTLIAEPAYTAADLARMGELLVQLGVYHVNAHGAVRRRVTADPPWAWLRKSAAASTGNPANHRRRADHRDRAGDWIGWVELATQAINETGTRMTARVIGDLDADILAIVEAEDRPALRRFNDELLARRYAHVMLVDGNDERGIDVGIMTKPEFEIASIRSEVDARRAGAGAGCAGGSKTWPSCWTRLGRSPPRPASAWPGSPRTGRPGGSACMSPMPARSPMDVSGGRWSSVLRPRSSTTTTEWCSTTSWSRATHPTPRSWPRRSTG